MTATQKLRFVLFLCGTLSAGSPAIAEESNLVRAKIGIEIISQDESRPAKTRDRLKSGTQLRVYILPEKNSFVYVINSDKNNAVLLNPSKEESWITEGLIKIFPSKAGLFSIEESGKIEFFSIICSPVDLNDVTTLFSSGVISRDKWLALEKDLVSRSKIQLNENLPKSFGIAGNIRGPGNEEFIKELSVFSGKELLVKRYEFNVKK